MSTPRPEHSSSSSSSSSSDSPASSHTADPAANEMQDCLGCKITGTLTGLGLGSYCLYERSRVRIPDRLAHVPPDTDYGLLLKKAVREARMHRNLLAVMSTGFFAVGIYRAFM